MTPGGAKIHLLFCNQVLAAPPIGNGSRHIRRRDLIAADSVPSSR